MLTFKRDTAEPPQPSTWNYVTHDKGPTGKKYVDNVIATFTCAFGHTSDLTRDIHTIIDPDGRLSPSCVCPFKGCSFHDWVRLEGWSWVWYNLNCAPERP